MRRECVGPVAGEGMGRQANPGYVPRTIWTDFNLQGDV